ncbi:class D beta-lactamase [Halopseudomonas formosensis]|uniref:Beta-lactamase n=1 Tax=Halopseudomonas formosensis TaxID=1002526 RepID=A0ABU5C2F0_9GAMM|nr:class D beta-lactamase [Halopseudomonas formosensis]MDX9688818.1 class D beta-lactamase [Halopseudomonas formosensis]
MKRFASALIFLLSSQAYGLDWQDSREIGQLFEEAGVEGTFVVYDVSAGRLVGHDRVRAHTRFTPASTFKIPNTLIGLSVGAVGNVDEVLPYGGAPQPFKAWEKDMSLRDAISASNAAIYQELARRIGPERMRDHVARIGYGSAEIGATVDDFWLTGPLKISAVEQTQFLAKLAENTLPFSKETQKSVSEIIRLEQRDSLTLYGKTGWENAPGPGTGWWVGWVKKGSHVYPFALNIDIRQASDASKRVELGKASLQALGLF